MSDPESLPLRDIHLPEALSWWPYAPGWWILLVIVFIAALVGRYWRQRKERIRLSAIQLAKVELQKIEARFMREKNAKATVQDISVLLRRLTISLFAREESAGLTGQQWLEFLDQPISQALFTQGKGQVMLAAPYQKEVKQTEAESLLQACQLWIEEVAQQGRKI